MAKGEGLKKIHVFHTRVGLLQLDDLEVYGIVPDPYLDVFFREREKEFGKRNSKN